MENSDGDCSGNRKRVKTLESYKKCEDTANPKKRRILKTNNPFFDEKIHCLVNEANKVGISSIPVEILLEIMSYLDCRDLYSLRGVSKFFERLVLEPSVWTTYESQNFNAPVCTASCLNFHESRTIINPASLICMSLMRILLAALPPWGIKVSNTGATTLEVIDELKRMPHLRRISIEARNDCDDILRQLSCSNKKLQRLNISNCTGTSGNLYLRPGYLIRILERCSRLHTITIRGSRFRGLKFYRILGDMGHRLKLVSASTTCMQFRTFAEHVSKVDENERDALCSMCPQRTRGWGPLRYYMVEKWDRTKTALVSYFYHDFLDVDLRPSTKSTTRIGAASLSPVTMCSSSSSS